MKQIITILIFTFLLLFFSAYLDAQCSICAKTSQQMGEKPAQGLNAGILYLMLMPFALVGIIGYRWWKNNR